MQILVQNGTILYTVDGDTTPFVYDSNQNQVVITTSKYTHNDLFRNIDRISKYVPLDELFTLPELITMYSNHVAKYYKDLINLEYPDYKQMNIIRQGKGYTPTDLQTMTTFIDNNRSACKAKIASISTLTNSDDVLKFEVYA